MAEFPALPLFTDAYLGDTTHLTTIEHGAYLLLLMVAWRSRDTCLPDDDVLLARYTKLTAAQWRRMRPILERFFEVENGLWRQCRLTDEANHVRQVRESQAANGRASALKRKDRHATKRKPIVNEARTPSPSPTPHIDDTAKAVSTRERSKLAEQPSDVSDVVWQDFKRLRKDKRAALTDTALGQIRKQAVEVGWSLEATLTECCTRGWQSFKADWINQGNGRNGNGTANGYRRTGRHPSEIDDAAVNLGFER